ncbi:hypothetical protein Q3G72_013280 [Acer saccharum]|nr:hypothetical protein Q3G72_013280 [Acer saccharum]
MSVDVTGPSAGNEGPAVSYAVDFLRKAPEGKYDAIIVDSSSLNWGFVLAAYGHVWYGRWEYTFCHGSFGLTEQDYNKAISIFIDLKLDKIEEDFRGSK